MMWLLILLAGLMVLRLGFFLHVLVTTSRHPCPSSPVQTEQLPVSVIICARNEAANLRKNLPRVLEQTYPAFEVIVVDDDSEDDTNLVLTRLQQNHTYLRIVKINQKQEVGKKAALKLGIAEARHKLLLMTDADCRPASEYWLQKMTAPLYNGYDATLGYSPLEKGRGWLNKVMRFETIQTGILYLGFALAGIPYMGVGRNLAYKKSIYRQAGGFQRHQHIASGDDDLLVNAISDKARVAVCIEPLAHTIAASEQNWFTWWRQKRRHMLAGTKYKRIHLVLLGIWHTGHLALYVLLIGLLLSPFYAWALALAGFYFLVQITIFNLQANELGDKDLVLISPVLDVAYLMQIILVSASLILKSTNRWK